MFSSDGWQRTLCDPIDMRYFVMWTAIYSLHFLIRRPLIWTAELRHSVEHQRSVDTADEARRFLARHPELGDDYQRWLQRQHQHGNPTDTTDSTATVGYGISSVHRFTEELAVFCNYNNYWTTHSVLSANAHWRTFQLVPDLSTNVRTEGWVSQYNANRCANAIFTLFIIILSSISHWH